ncbi:MAG: NAD(P)/FAD-dependent oxidoreductase [Planctomycetota bacterium]
MIKRLLSAKKGPSDYDVVVVGAGPAGIGVAVALKDAGIENFIVLDRRTIGSSFEAWPAETRFITPSFPTNSVGMLDLNSIAIGASPAFSLKVEHPTGTEYALHLRQVAAVAQLPVREHTSVLRITHVGSDFRIDTAEETLRTKHVIWAGGEYQFPKRDCFPGSELCRHTSTVPSYEELEGDQFIVIGGYESGIDAAYHLARYNKRIYLFDRGRPWSEPTSDPSVAISTYTQERMRDERFARQVRLFPDKPVTSVTQTDTGYEVTTRDGPVVHSENRPLLATGFEGSHKLVSDLFESREDGFPLLTANDESTLAPGLFLCGPSVRHEDHVFCFIYKYRQRFAVVAKAIATSLELPAPQLEEYRNWGMYLDDLSCCGEECVC